MTVYLFLPLYHHSKIPFPHSKINRIAKDIDQLVITVFEFVILDFAKSITCVHIYFLFRPLSHYEREEWIGLLRAVYRVPTAVMKLNSRAFSKGHNNKFKVHFLFEAMENKKNWNQTLRISQIIQLHKQYLMNLIHDCWKQFACFSKIWQHQDALAIY